MQFMVIEYYRDRTPHRSISGFRARACLQIMETDDPALLDKWVAA